MRIRKGDTVRVMTGKNKGRTAEVVRAIPEKNRVIVEGVNVAKKHQRQTKARVKGGIIDRDMPVQASSVALVCGKDGPVRVGYRYKVEGDRRSKVRVCKRCGREL